ncbi:MAG: putative sigma-54 modulation protein [Gammaproteobacteria bacterium]|jgi:putative sigma-54 modulation protein
MQIDIQASHFSVTDTLRTHAERRLRFALTFCDDQIQRIVMRLSDINGPRGGSDKCCHLQVTLSGMNDVIVKDIEADLYVAIDRAANRAARTVKRQLTRRRDRSRTRGPQETGSIDECSAIEINHQSGDNPQ